MKSLVRLQDLLITPRSSRMRSTTITREDIRMNLMCGKPKNIELPQHQKLWVDYINLENSISFHKTQHLDELVIESKIIQNCDSEHFLNKAWLVLTNFDILKKKNKIEDSDSIVTALLGVLDLFPFNREELLQKNEEDLSIYAVRKVIEKQYLAWMFHVDVKHVELILNRYKDCFYKYRSVGNLQRNVKMLKSLSNIHSLSLCQKIFFSNQVLLQKELIENFKKEIEGPKLEQLVDICPKVLAHSYQYSIFLRSAFKIWGFTEEQIMAGYPALNIPFHRLLKRLNFLLTHPNLKNYRNEVNFLMLLSINQKNLKDLLESWTIGFAELLEYSSKKPQGFTFLNMQTILFQVNQFFNVDQDSIRILIRHPKYRMASKSKIFETLAFLKDLKFNDKELAESIPIILYPKEQIKNALEKINSDGEALEKLGFKNGCVSEETKFFTKGTKERRKTLQLCLYYIEKPYNFSGDGIWGAEIDDETD